MSNHELSKDVGKTADRWGVCVFFLTRALMGL